jgi:hypothetical protein
MLKHIYHSRSFVNQFPYYSFITQAITCGERVLYMTFGIFLLQRNGNNLLWPGKLLLAEKSAAARMSNSVSSARCRARFNAANPLPAQMMRFEYFNLA